MKEGEIVITCDTNQSGTIQWISGETAQVLLRNAELWTGSVRSLRLPQSPEDLASTVEENAQRLAPKTRIKSKGNK